MKRALLGVVAVAALGATLVSTGAFVDQVEDTEDKIEMEPSDGPNAVYAVEDSDGEIKLDLSESNQALAEDAEGISEDSLTRIPNIFTVNYSAAADEPAAEVWFTSDAGEGIEFVVGTDTVNPIDGEDSKRTLLPTEKLHVGIVVDTRGAHDVENVSEFTIHVETVEADGDVSESAPPDQNNPTGDTTNQEAENEEEMINGDEEPDQDETTDQDNTTVQNDTTDQNGTESGDGDGDNTGSEGGEDSTGDGTDGGATNGTEQNGGGDTGAGGASGSGGNGGDGDTGQEGDEDDGSGGATADDGGGFQTPGQGPSFPGPEENLGGFLSGTFLWLIVAVLVGAALFAATRYGTERFGGEA
jgi:hypothetical protein